MGRKKTASEKPASGGLRAERRDPEDRIVDPIDWQAKREKMLDKTIADSFPASDAPSSLPDPREDSFSKNSPANAVRGSEGQMIDTNATPVRDSAGSVVVRGNATEFSQSIEAGKHELKSDEPLEAGGTDTGPSPYDLLLAALGSCTSMTVALYARRKQWPLQGVAVRLRHSRIHAADCADCETKEGLLDRIEREIILTGSLTDEQRARLLEIAEKCPIHRTLTSEIQIESWLA